MTTSRAQGATCNATVNAIPRIHYTCTLPEGHAESHSAPLQFLRDGVPEVDKAGTQFTWSDSFAREAGWNYTSHDDHCFYDTSLDPISPNFNRNTW